MNVSLLGRWAFLFGLLISLVAGLGGEIPALLTILFALGLVVGFLNVTEKESTPFLVAVIALLIGGVSGLQLGQLTTMVTAILQNIIAFVSAAGLVVAIKQILEIAKSA